MCSPELWKGMCCICLGSLKPENTLYDDLYEGRGGIHRGVCAILAGIYPSDELAYIGQWIIHFSHQMRGKDRDQATRNYHAWVHSVADEDHYWNEGEP